MFVWMPKLNLPLLDIAQNSDWKEKLMVVVLRSSSQNSEITVV